MLQCGVAFIRHGQTVHCLIVLIRRIANLNLQLAVLLLVFCSVLVL